MYRNAPLLLLDTGYVSVYRFHACQKWYRLTHPGNVEVREESYDWSKNTEFVNKYRELFFAGLSKTLRRFRIPRSNILFAVDDSRDNIWRKDLLPSYKTCRRAKHQVGLGVVLDMVRNDLIPKLVEQYSVTEMFFNKLEADDVIGIVTRHVISNKLFPQIIILTNDKDFVQLTHPKVSIINFQGQLLQPKNFTDPLHELLFHILCGDKSDSITPCFPRCNRQTASRYIRDPLQLVQLLKTNPEIEKRFIINRQLIDFSQIPRHFQRKVIRGFTSLYHQKALASLEKNSLTTKATTPTKNI